MPPLSVAVITLNEEKNLERCLASVRDLATEIIVVDAGSTDGTRAIAEKFGARWVHQDWLGHRDQKNVALDLCREDWVLGIDADEELSPRLRESIGEFLRNDRGGWAGAYFARKVWFLGRWIEHGDWYPDYSLRLFRREKARWGGSLEHDKIVLEGKARKLMGDLHHYSFPTLNRFVEKINVFGDALLKRQLESGKRWKLSHNLFRPFWRFVRAYIIRCGFLDGYPGLWIATATAFSAFVRHSRLYEDEVNRNPQNATEKIRP